MARRKKQGAKSPKKSRRKSTARSIGPGGKAPGSVSNRSIVTMPKGFPMETRTKLCYSDLADLIVDIAPGYYNHARFAMNDPTDPDITGSGSQPPMFDNLRAIYSAWRVNSCKIVCDIENYTNSPCFVTLVGLYDGTTNPTSPENPNTYDLMALPTTVRSARKRLATVNAQAKNVTRLSKTFKPEDIVGQDYFSSVNFQGGSGAPAKIAYIDVIAQSGNPAVTSEIGLWLSWRIEYDISFYDEIATELAAYD